MDDLDDLLGAKAPAEPPRRRRGRPTREEAAARLAAMQAEAKLIAAPTAEDTRRPMTVRQLADVTRMDFRTVEQRLLHCPVADWDDGIGAAKGKRVPRFKFMTAMPYLVEPKFDLEAILFSMSGSNSSLKIPTNLQKGFWDAMNAKAKWLREAKQTWHDEDVLEVLGKVAIMIRETSLLWVENLPGKDKLTTEDYHALRAQVSDLLNQIKKHLVTLPAQRRTESVAVDLEHMDDSDAETLANTPDAVSG